MIRHGPESKYRLLVSNQVLIAKSSWGTCKSPQWVQGISNLQKSRNPVSGIKDSTFPRF